MLSITDICSPTFFTALSKESLKKGYYVCGIMDQTAIALADVDYAEMYFEPIRTSTMELFHENRMDLF